MAVLEVVEAVVGVGSFCMKKVNLNYTHSIMNYDIPGATLPKGLRIGQLFD